VEQALNHPWTQKDELCVDGMEEEYVQLLRSELKKSLHMRREPTALHSQTNDFSTLASQFSQLPIGSAASSYVYVDGSPFSVLSDGVGHSQAIQHAASIVEPLTPANEAPSTTPTTSIGTKREHLASSSELMQGGPMTRAAAKRLRQVGSNWQ
jgi:hypothetical protein